MSADCQNDSRNEAARRLASGGARGNSQQRVGILRNPNRAPLPPPRRAALTGKWPSLRSSRRPQPDSVMSAARAVAGEGYGDGDSDVHTVDEPLSVAPDTLQTRQSRLRGNGAPNRDKPARAGKKDAVKINIAKLMDDVADLGERKSKRARFGASASASTPAPAPAAHPAAATATTVATGGETAELPPLDLGDDPVLSTPEMAAGANTPRKEGKARRLLSRALAALATLIISSWLSAWLIMQLA